MKKQGKEKDNVSGTKHNNLGGGLSEEIEKAEE